MTPPGFGCSSSSRRSRTLTSTAAAILFVSCRKAVVCFSSTPSLSSSSIRQQLTRSPWVFSQQHHSLFTRSLLLSPLRAGSLDSTHDTPINVMTDMARGIMTTTAPTTAAEKLKALRSSMNDERVDVYLVPSDDPHLSEYTPEAYKRRGFLTDFHGSAGTAVVTQSTALLWTDSR